MATVLPLVTAVGALMIELAYGDAISDDDKTFITQCFRRSHVVESGDDASDGGIEASKDDAEISPGLGKLSSMEQDSDEVCSDDVDASSPSNVKPSVPSTEQQPSGDLSVELADVSEKTKADGTDCLGGLGCL